MTSDLTDPDTARATRLLIRAMALRWHAASGICGSDRAALLAAAVVLERMAHGSHPSASPAVTTISPRQ